MNSIKFDGKKYSFEKSNSFNHIALYEKQYLEFLKDNKRYYKNKCTAYEVIFDKSQKYIIGLIELNKNTLSFCKDFGLNKNVWIQYTNNYTNTRILLESQVIFIPKKNVIRKEKLNKILL